MVPAGYLEQTPEHHLLRLIACSCTGAREIVEAVELARAHGPLRWYSEGLPVKRAGALLTPFVHHGARRWAVKSAPGVDKFCVYHRDNLLRATLSLEA